jgi:hypothetical protein
VTAATAVGAASVVDGHLCTQVSVPLLSAGTYEFRVKTTVPTLAVSSPVSNARTIDILLAAGGTGGSPFGPIDCSATKAITALKGNYSTAFAPVGAIGTTEVYCSPMPPSIELPVLAGAYTSPASPMNDYGAALTCPAGKYVTGITGLTPAFGVNVVVGPINVICSLPDGTSPETVGPTSAANSGGATFTLACPTGQVAVGIAGRGGFFIDQIQLRCGVR